MKARVTLIVLGSVVLALGLVALGSEDLRKLDLRRLPSRAGWQLPGEVLTALGLEEGDRVADLGAGDGYFVTALAAAVGTSGRVYAVEIDAEALRNLEQRVARERLATVEVIAASAVDPGLPDGEIDLVFLCDVYHHIGSRAAYFRRLRGDLAPGGRVAVVEPRARGFGHLLSPSGHSTPFAELVEEMEGAGYRLEESFDFLPFQNFFVFRVSDP